MTNIQKLIKSYYHPYNEQSVRAINDDIITAKTEPQRELLLKKYGSLINKLKPRFKKLVLERNKLAQKHGFDNYFDSISDWDKIPKKKLNGFSKKGEESAKKIFDSLPDKFKDQKWLKGNYNNFN